MFFFLQHHYCFWVKWKFSLSTITAFRILSICFLLADCAVPCYFFIWMAYMCLFQDAFFVCMHHLAGRKLTTNPGTGRFCSRSADGPVDKWALCYRPGRNRVPWNLQLEHRQEMHRLNSLIIHHGSNWATGWHSSVRWLNTIDFNRIMIRNCFRMVGDDEEGAGLEVSKILKFWLKSDSQPITSLTLLT